MKRIILTALLISLVCASLTSAKTVFVDDDGPADFNNIQAAIDDCNDGDTVIVADGIFTGTGNRDIDFKGKAITVRSDNGPDNCIIDCQDSGRGFYFHSEEDEDSVLDGFTITNGYGSDGGGIYCRYGSPTITNCTISGNLAEDDGGGVYCYRSSSTITNCTITDNMAGNGGGISCRISGQTINNCTISGNLAEDDGGGVYCYRGSPTITNCTITDNMAGNGGGIDCYYRSQSTIINCTFSGNAAEAYGAGVFCDSDSSSMITNCAFIGNAAEVYGGGVFCDNGSSSTITNSIFWGNTDTGGTSESSQITYSVTPQVIYSCIQDDDPNDTYIPFGDANGNIDDNPMFVRNPDDGGDGWGVGDNDDFGDLHLTVSSPCIEAGNPNFSAGPNCVDIDGQPRIIGFCVDMGADEFAPMVVVKKPQGGEVWVSGSLHEITWSGYGVDVVDILFSKDGGGNWQLLESNVADTGGYTWHLPDIVDSAECLISVVPSVPDPNVVCIESGLFTIWPDSPGPVVESKWKSLGGDFDRAGMSKNYGPELGCIKWQFETDGAVSGSITIGVDDRVAIASEDGKVYTLDADGVLLWSCDTNSPLTSSPTIGPDGTVYVGSQNGRLYAIDIDGSLRWTHTTDGFIYSSPAVSPDGNIYACSEDSVLYALAPDGSELWSFQTDGPGVLPVGSIFASPAIGADGTIYIVGLYDPNLYALDPNDGSIKWACNFEFPIDPCDPNSDTKAGWPFASPVVAADGTIYQSLLHDSSLYAIEHNAGIIIWSTDLADPCTGWFEPSYYTRYSGPTFMEYRISDSGWSEPALGPDGTIYVSSDDPYLRAVDPDGNIKWVTRLGMMGGFTLTVGSNGLIYAASDDGHLYVVNAGGEEIARFQSDDWLNFPVITADNTIIVSGSKDNSMLISDVNNTVWAIGGDNCAGQLDLHRPPDLNGDRTVDYFELALLADDWLECTDISIYAEAREMICDYEGDGIYPAGDVDRNLYVDFADFAELANQWLSEY